MFFKYADAIDELLSLGHKILDLLEFEESRYENVKSERYFVNRFDLIERNFRAWRTSFLLYLKINFSRECNIYIDLLEKEIVCDISTVRLYLNILHQVKNGVFEEIIHPDSYLLEKDKINEEARDYEVIQHKLYNLNNKIKHKITTITISFVIALVSFVFAMFILWAIFPNDNYNSYYGFFNSTNVIIALGFSLVIGILFFLIRYSMLISAFDRFESEIKMHERKRESIKNSDVVKDVSDSVQNRIFEEIPSQIVKQIINEINSGNVKIENRSINFYDNDKLAKKIASTDESRSVFRTQMRELFHSLMTPITTVNRSLTNINISKTDDNFTEVFDENLEIIKNSMSYVDALLYAYRSMAMLNFNPEDILSAQQNS